LAPQEGQRFLTLVEQAMDAPGSKGSYHGTAF
jgi:hypothetical protein